MSKNKKEEIKEEKKVSEPISVVCATCKGTGRHLPEQTCPACNGTGKK